MGCVMVLGRVVGRGSSPKPSRDAAPGCDPRTLLASRLGTPPIPSIRYSARGELLRLTPNQSKSQRSQETFVCITFTIGLIQVRNPYSEKDLTI